MKNQENKAKALMAFSMFVFGTIPFFVRNIALSSSQLALYRAILAVILIGSYLMMTKQKIEFSKIKKELVLLMVSGAFMAMNWILLFEAYKYASVSIATLSYYFAPVIMMIVCPIIWKEKITKKQIICFVVSSIGLVFISYTSGHGNNDLMGIAFGLMAAILYATVMIFNKAIKEISGIYRTFIQFLTAVIVLIPYVGISDGFTLFTLDTLSWFYLLIVGFIHTGINCCLYFHALKDLPGQKVAILSYIYPFVALLVSVVLLHETMTMMQMFGGILILGFTLYSEYTQ